MSKPEIASWVYLKLFVAPPGEPVGDTGAMLATVDLLLREHLLPALRNAHEAGLCQAYFFIRYAEGGYHLRIRSRCADEASGLAVVAHIDAALDAMLRAHPGVLGCARSSGELKAAAQLQQCRYEPEIDKYCGPSGVRLAEAHFHHCTTLVESALQLRAQGLDMAQMALWLMGQAMFALPLEPTEMLTVMGGYATFWRNSCLPGQHDVGSILDQHYTRKRAGILQFLPAGRGHPDTAFATAHPQVEARLGTVRALYSQTLARMGELEKAGQLASSFQDHLRSGDALVGQGPNISRLPLSYLLVLPNLLHMLNNRLGLDVLQESQLAHFMSRALAERFELVERPFAIVLEPSSLQVPEVAAS